MANTKIPDLPAIAAILSTTLFEVDDASGTPGASHRATGIQILNYVMAAIVDSAPSTLDTLNELAAALGDDPNFATTMTNALAGKVAKAGDTLTGALNFATIKDVASAATTDIGAVTSNLVRVTGSTGITSFGTIAAGALKIVRFSGAPLLTHSANLILPGAANIQIVADDVMVLWSEGGGVWRVLHHQETSLGQLGGAWTAYTPTWSATTPAGSGFAVTTNSYRYKKVGRTVTLSMVGTITSLGTGPAASGALQVDVPFTPAAASSGYGSENGVTGVMVQGNVSGGSTTMQLKKYDGGTLLVVGYQVRVTMTYEASA